MSNPKGERAERLLVGSSLRGSPRKVIIFSKFSKENWDTPAWPGERGGETRASRANYSIHEKDLGPLLSAERGRSQLKKEFGDEASGFSKKRTV